MPNQLLTPEQVAELLAVKEGTLAVWRCTKRGGPPYIKVGRSIRYDSEALRAYLERRTCPVEDFEPAGAMA